MITRHWLVAVVMSIALLTGARAGAPQAPASRALIDELALANRILATENVFDAYGHVSVRSDRDPAHYFLSRNKAPGLVTASDLVEYDLDSKPVAGDAPGYTERFIHGEIYRARPDVRAVVHMHAAELIPFSVTSVPLRPVAHLAAFLGEGVPKFEIRDVVGASDMLIRSPELGRALAKTLADKPAALMRGHGAVVVAPSLHVVVGRAYYMALNARLQQQALVLGGKITYLDVEEARKASTQDGYERAWSYWSQKASK